MLKLCPWTLVQAVVTGEGWVAGPFHLVRWKLQVRGHPVPSGGSRLRLHENELICAQLDHAKIRGDSGCIYA